MKNRPTDSTKGTRLNVIERARLYVAKIPPAISGEGGHNHAFAVACALIHGFALPRDRALSLLREYSDRCQPPWSERELAHKIESAVDANHFGPRGHILGVSVRPLQQSHFSVPKTEIRCCKPLIDPVTATENFLDGFWCDEAELWEASPIRPPEDWHEDALALLSHLFQPGDQVNFVTQFSLVDENGRPPKAKPSGYGQTVERDKLIDRWDKKGMPCTDAGGWLRINPMDCNGVADSNVVRFRFALVECDDLPLTLQLPLLARLPLPITAIVTSGGRSIHAWIQVDATSLDEYRATVRQMLNLLSKFGVDVKNKNPSRMSRIPGLIRKIGAQGNGRQKLLYLNPTPDQKAIL
jgi:hypothetical protein